VTRLRTLLVVLLFLFAAWEPGVVIGEDGWQALKLPAPKFELKDLEGRALRPADLAGKIAVVDFWATWCAPCVIEMPDLVEFHESLAGRSDVVFLSFNVTEEAEVVAAFAKKRKLPFRIFLADTAQDGFGVEYYPAKFVLDYRDPGKPLIRFRRDGTATGAELHAKVKALLAEGAAKKAAPAKP
jgi:thiol-disulfide isomerase/thioredoxin